MAEEKTVDAVVVPENLQRSSLAGEVLSMQGDIEPEKLMEIARKRLDFFDSVTKLSLKRTSVNDWVDLQGKPYLQSTGAEKLMALWGIYTKDVKITLEMDLTTGLPAYEVNGRVGSRVLGTEMDIIGGRNANDPFFAKQDRLDLLDVRKAAYSNWLVNAVTRIIGMRGLTWAEVQAATSGKVTSGTATGKVTYNDGVISEAQVKRFFAIAKGAGWKDAEIKDYLMKNHGIEHSKEIPKSKYEQICKDMEAGGSH
jgi:hypothetical protein